MNRLKMNSPALAALAILLMAWINRCSSPIAGGTDMPNENFSVVQGEIQDSSGTALPHAKLLLMVSARIITQDAKAVDSTYSDSSGKYRFTHVGIGRYQVLGYSKDKVHIALSENITIGDSAATYHIHSIANPTSQLTGHVSIHMDSSLSYRVWLWATPFSTPLRPDGGYEFSQITPGRHIVLLMVGDERVNSWGFAASDTVIVAAGTSLAVDTVRPLEIARTQNRVLVEDFEDGDDWNFLGTRWFFYDDSKSGKPSDPISAITGSSFRFSPGVGGTGSCLQFSYQLNSKRAFAFVGVGHPLGLPLDTVVPLLNLSKLDSIKFSLKGNAEGVSMILRSELSDVDLEVLHLDRLTDSWTQYTVALDTLLSNPGDTRFILWERTKYFQKYLQFHIAGDPASIRTSGTIAIDNIELIFK